MERLAEDLSLCEHEELATAIFEYKDLFSSGPEDMGHTVLVTQSNDT